MTGLRESHRPTEVRTWYRAWSSASSVSVRDDEPGTVFPIFHPACSTADSRAFTGLPVASQPCKKEANRASPAPAVLTTPRGAIPAACTSVPSRRPSRHPSEPRPTAAIEQPGYWVNTRATHSVGAHGSFS